jgi:hypothetical protein
VKSAHSPSEREEPVREGRPLNASPPDFLRLPCSLHLSRRCAYYPRAAPPDRHHYLVPPAHRIACTASTPLLSSLSFLRCASTITSPPRITTPSSFSSRLLVLYIIRTSRFLNFLVDDISASASFMFFPQTTAQYAYAQHAINDMLALIRSCFFHTEPRLDSRAHYSRCCSYSSHCRITRARCSYRAACVQFGSVMIGMSGLLAHSMCMGSELYYINVIGISCAPRVRGLGHRPLSD